MPTSKSDSGLLQRGRSDTAVHAACFAVADYSDITTTTNKYLLAWDDQVAEVRNLQKGDEDYFPGGVSLEYGKSPNFTKDQLPTGIDVTSLFIPNINSPGGDLAAGVNLNYEDKLPMDAAEVEKRYGKITVRNPDWKDPHETSVSLKTRAEKKYKFGSSK